MERAQYEKGKTFSSPHEGYAIIKEEVEECTEEILGAWRILNDLWERVKNDDDTDMQIDVLKSYAEHVAAEAVQVAAMCDKFYLSRYEWKENENEESTCD